ncbi:MAG TPA: phosphoribosyltransferase [Sphingomicrobium sp.]|nr:phosphoribosyltransferase [Sphingomicrobium sp.]
MAAARRPSARRVVGMAEAEKFACELAELVKASNINPDLVIGIANGGVHPAFHLAETLQVPICTYRVSRASARLKEQLEFVRHALAWRIIRRIIRGIRRNVDGRRSDVSHDPDKLEADVKGKRILIVDDCIDSGAAMAAVRSMLRERGAADVRIAVLCWTMRFDSSARYGIAPDFFLFRHLDSYPWSLENPQFPKFRQWLRGQPQA